MNSHYALAILALFCFMIGLQLTVHVSPLVFRSRVPTAYDLLALTHCIGASFFDAVIYSLLFIWPDILEEVMGFVSI